jgi:hypothetical protein
MERLCSDQRRPYLSPRKECAGEARTLTQVPGWVRKCGQRPRSGLGRPKARHPSGHPNHGRREPQEQPNGYREPSYRSGPPDLSLTDAPPPGIMSLPETSKHRRTILNRMQVLAQDGPSARDREKTRLRFIRGRVMRTPDRRVVKSTTPPQANGMTVDPCFARSLMVSSIQPDKPAQRYTGTLSRCCSQVEAWQAGCGRNPPLKLQLIENSSNSSIGDELCISPCAGGFELIPEP